jgi:hypothetical protein
MGIQLAPIAVRVAVQKLLRLLARLFESFQNPQEWQEPCPEESGWNGSDESACRRASLDSDVQAKTASSSARLRQLDSRNR